MNAKNLIISVIMLLVGFAGGTVLAQSGKHSTSVDHGNHTSSSVLREGGQAAFDAIAEIVSMLEADPDTDWSKVNINALHDHLADMNALTLSSMVEAYSEAQSMRFVAKGTGTTLRAIQNMVPAHAFELDKMPNWSVVGRAVSGGAELIVTTNDDATREKVRGLGFFGLMATGAHHRKHHLAIAVGNPMH